MEEVDVDPLFDNDETAEDIPASGNPVDQNQTLQDLENSIQPASMIPYLRRFDSKVLNKYTYGICANPQPPPSLPGCDSSDIFKG